MTKKPILVEIYAWNEPLLALYTIGWALFLGLFDWEESLSSGRYFIGLFIGSGGVALLAVQSQRLRTLIDFRLPALALKVSPAWMQRFWLKVWPASTLVRLTNHFFFTVWWLLMAVVVALNIDDLADVRFIAYVVIALLHFDRFLRLLQWMRK